MSVEINVKSIWVIIGLYVNIYNYIYILYIYIIIYMI